MPKDSTRWWRRERAVGRGSEGPLVSVMSALIYSYPPPVAIGRCYCDALIAGRKCAFCVTPGQIENERRAIRARIQNEALLRAVAAAQARSAIQSEKTHV